MATVWPSSFCTVTSMPRQHPLFWSIAVPAIAPPSSYRNWGFVQETPIIRRVRQRRRSLRVASKMERLRLHIAGGEQIFGSGRQQLLRLLIRTSYGQKTDPADAPSGCLLMIVAQEAAQSLAAPHGPLTVAVRIPRKQQDVAFLPVIPSRTNLRVGPQNPSASPGRTLT